MKIAITGKRDITSKKGDEYTIYNGITPTGRTVELFLSSDQVARFKLPSAVVPPAEQLEAALDLLPTVDAQFNEQGRIEDITV